MALRAGAVLTLVAGSLVATATSAFATTVPATVSPTHGPSGGGYNVVLTEGTPGTISGSTGPYEVQFNFAGTCPAAAAATAALAGSGSTLSAGVVDVASVAKPGSGSTVTVPVPAGLVLPSGMTSGLLSVCVYDTGNSGGELLNADAAFTVLPDATPASATGAVGGNYQLGITSTTAPFTISNPQVQLQAKTATSTGCALTAQGAATPSGTGGALTGGVYAIPAAGITVAATNKINVMIPATVAQPASVFSAGYYVCVYNAAGSTLLAENQSASLFTIQGNVALSNSSGSSAGGNTITLGAPSGTIFTAGTQKVALTIASCPSTYSSATGVGTTVVPSSTRYVSATKIAFTLPTSGLPTSNTSYNVCAYDSAGTTLLAQGFGSYTVGQVPTVSSVSPATGPAQGGTTISVTGANFPATGMTATLGGTPLTGIVVGNITSGVGTTFTATVPAHSPGGPFALAVTTTGGTVNANGVFTYTNGITVTPKTAPNSSVAPTGLDIQGVGFSDLVFSGTYNTNSTNAHVYLVKGVYSGGTTAGSTAVKPNPQTSECVDVLVVGDTELLCNLYLGGNLNAAPTATTRTLSSCANYTSATAAPPSSAPTTPTLYVGPSSSTVTTCSFTQADVGTTITAGASGAVIPVNATVITAVSAGGIATLSKLPVSAVTSTTTPITTSNQRSMTDGVTTSGATTLAAGTSANATTFFTAADVNKVVTGPGIPTGTYIVSVTSGVATLSNPATATTGSSGVTGFSIYNPTPVPNGTYTVTVVSNGAPGAQLAATYYQTIISSGSTFTVADYTH